MSHITEIEFRIGTAHITIHLDIDGVGSQVVYARQHDAADTTCAGMERQGMTADIRKNICVDNVSLESVPTPGQPTGTVDGDEIGLIGGIKVVGTPGTYRDTTHLAVTIADGNDIEGIGRRG